MDSSTGSPGSTGQRFMRLVAAISTNNAEEVSKLVTKLEGYVNHKIPWDSEGFSPLHLAAKESNAEIFSLLINSRFVNVNAIDNNGSTPLHVAAQINNPDIIKLLLSAKNIGVNLRNNAGLTALAVAVQAGNTENQRLLDESARKNVGAKNRGHAALQCTFEKLNMDAEILIDAGTNNNDETKLLWAIEKNDVSLMESLLVRGANVNSKSHNTLLHLAARKCNKDSHVDMLRVLLNHGADVNARDASESTALHLLMNFNNLNFKSIQLLIHFNANVNVVNYTNKTPLFIAVKSRSAWLVRLLLDTGANISTLNAEGENALFDPVKNNNLEMVQLLVNYGADVNCINKQNEILLNLAALKHGNREVLSCLVKNGAYVNAVDFRGKTPLLHLLDKSSFSGYFMETLEFMLNCSDINLVDQGGKNVLNKRNEIGWKTVLKHIAKLKALGDISINQSILNSIENDSDYKDYFMMCTQELDAAKKKKLKNSWVTYFNLLVDSSKKLKNYAGNKDLVEDFESSDYLNIFSVYGPTIQKNMTRGIERRKLFDRSSIVLSDCLPIFNPNHLIIRDIFDLLTTKNLSKFCE